MTYEPRAGDVRALAVSLGLGAFIGLAIGGAYIVGGVAREQVSKPLLAQADRIQTPRPIQPVLGSNRAVGTKISLRDRFDLAFSLTRSVVQPFHFKTADAGSGDQARETQCLAQAVYYEARGETPSGQAAVAQVVLNRVRHPAFPKTVCGVVFQRAGSDCQFSFACNGAMRQPLDQTAWRRATSVAERALSGAVMAEVGAATHFQAARSGADWAGGLAKVAQIGEHIFYRFSGRAGTPRMFHAEAQRSGPDSAPDSGPPADQGRIHSVFAVATASQPAATPAASDVGTSQTAEVKIAPPAPAPKPIETAIKAPATPLPQAAVPDAASDAQPLKASEPEKSKPVVAATTTQS